MIHRLRGARRLGIFAPGLVALFLILTLSAFRSGYPVQIHDGAHVLNVSQIQNTASQLSNPVAIYTTNNFQGTQADFQRVATQKLSGHPNLIVVAIDTAHRYIFVAHGSNVPLSSSGVTQAVSAFRANYGSGDYTNASLAALSSLQNSLGTSQSVNSNANTHANTQRGAAGYSVSPIWLCCIIPVALILGGIIFGAIRRGHGRGMLGGLGRGGPAPYQPMVPPGYPTNQGPYYGPPQRGGMNPWAAGGLGAAAGGLAGYELGKMQGERQDQQNMGYGDPGQYGAGGNFGNGQGFGGNSGGGFGNDDFGAGGNFGNDDLGAGGGFGGDQGAGGGFGSDDFGSGGSFGNDDGGAGGNF
jgi:hypothetical protein